MANNRTVKIQEEFKRSLSEIFLTDLKDPRKSDMITVTRVMVTADLKYAKIYVSIYDSPEKISSTMDALKSAEGFIRARLNDKVRLRRIPSLEFVHDASIEYSVKISKIIDDVTSKDTGDGEDTENI